MLDLSHIPNSQQDVQIFYANEGIRAYQTWKKPRKCNFVYILSVDGGGGGGGGGSTTLNATGNVNIVGGGSGTANKLLVNASFVPDILYIKVGKGGSGGASFSGSNNSFNPGNIGETSGVFASSTQSSQNNGSQASSFIGGNVSAAGGNASAGVGGSSASSISNNFLIGLTNFVTLSGRASTGGSITTQPVNIDPLISHIVTSGGAGAPSGNGTTPFNGAGINASSISPFIAGGIGGSLVGTNGDNGFTSWKPFFSTGGAGGGNSYSPGGVAGNGGNGGIGSGGGAGGSSNAGTGGRGGDGGDGVVIIISF